MLALNKLRSEEKERDMEFDRLNRIRMGEEEEKEKANLALKKKRLADHLEKSKKKRFWRIIWRKVSSALKIEEEVDGSS